MVHLTEVDIPTEGIRLLQANTAMDVDGKDFGNGTLFISESCLVWQKESDGLGLNVSYPSVSCHAVCRDLNFFPHECLHLMVEYEEDQGQEEDREEEDYSQGVANIRFIPLDKEQLLPMYTAMSQCQKLHPDPASDDCGEETFEDIDEDEEDVEEEFFNTANGAAHLTTAGQTQLARLDAILQFGHIEDPSSAGGHSYTHAPSEGCSPAGSDPAEQFQDADMD